MSDMFPRFRPLHFLAYPTQILCRCIGYRGFVMEDPTADRLEVIDKLLEVKANSVSRGGYKKHKERNAFAERGILSFDS